MKVGFIHTNHPSRTVPRNFRTQAPLSIQAILWTDANGWLLMEIHKFVGPGRAANPRSGRRGQHQCRERPGYTESENDLPLAFRAVKVVSFQRDIRPNISRSNRLSDTACSRAQSHRPRPQTSQRPMRAIELGYLDVPTVPSNRMNSNRYPDEQILIRMTAARRTHGRPCRIPK